MAIFADDETGYFSPSTIGSIVCPEKWAAFANQVNCANVWPGYQRKFELSGTYYTENIIVEELMLAQAAVRMASILNFIAVQ